MCSCGSLDKVSIVHRDEADAFVRENSGTMFIHQGYRKPKRTHLFHRTADHHYDHDLSFFDCMWTLWLLSNETLNVWTHLVATVAFAVVFPLHLLSSGLPLMPLTAASSGGGGWSVVWALLDASMLPVLAWVLFFIGCTFSFATSTAYHLFLFHSPQWFSFWVRLDLLGVTAAICASSFLGLGLAFQCSPVIFFIYTIFV